MNVPAQRTTPEPKAPPQHTVVLGLANLAAAVRRAQDRDRVRAARQVAGTPPVA